MTAANTVKRMALDRVIEFGEPIGELAVNTSVPADPLLRVQSGQSHIDLHANTGERYQGEERTLWQLADDNLTGYALSSDLHVRVDGRNVLARTARDTDWRTLSGHTTSITAITMCLSRGKLLVVSASTDGTIRIWDPSSGKQLRTGASLGRVDLLVSYNGSDERPRIASADNAGKVKIWDPLLPPSPRIAPVSTRGFNDRVAQEDLLDRGMLVEALRDVLRPDDDDGPTVITVEGAWGSGKSTLLELLRNRLPTPPTTIRRRRRFTVSQADWMLYRPPAGMPPPKKIEPMINPLAVSFNPWRHQSSEQVWAGLAKAVTEAAETAIMPHQNNRERYWFARNAGRVDRRHLQRQLWKRIFSPLLSFAGLGFGLSLLGALTKLNVGWAWWVTAGLAVAGTLHTAVRYFFGKASAFLPGELFAGPVTSNAFSGTTTDPLIRDPYYHARSGYLYLVQHDIRALLKDLEAHRYRLILLIDDLDRCTPRTTAQVFEAINVFLSDDFPAMRFVLGLDATVVAAHVDTAYKELADAKIVTHPDDPSPGWTFLRKLVQLPVRLPRTTADNVDQILRAQLGPVRRDELEPVRTPSDRPVLAPGELYALAWADDVERVVITIEQHSDVREHLQRRLRAQPEQSVREEKRLLNVWQFYLRVLISVDIEQAGHLVAVAEIAVRWPACLHRLRGGWQELADAVDDDVRWGATIAKLGFAYSDRKAAANLRELLRDCDAQAVAGLANRLF